MKRLTFAPAARVDLLAIGDYIAADDSVRAGAFGYELEATTMQAAEQPRSFASREDIGPGLSGVSHGRYLLFFREFADEVRIVRVVYSARDLRRIIRDG